MLSVELHSRPYRHAPRLHDRIEDYLGFVRSRILECYHARLTRAFDSDEMVCMNLRRYLGG